MIEDVQLEDSPITWYDFGGGNFINPEASSQAYNVALTCARNGKFYYMAIDVEGIKGEDLPALYGQYASKFEKDIQESSGVTQQ